jgi:hypothetical protein
MLQDQNTTPDKSFLKDLKDLSANMLPNLKDIEGAIFDVYKEAVNLNDVFGQNKERLSEIQKVIFDIRPEIAAFGGDMGDVMGLMEGVSKATSRNVLITAQDAKELYATQKVIGGSVQDIVEKFTQAGVQVSKIKDEAEKAVQYVQSMGLNTKDVMDLVSRNFEKLNEYNFSQGVEGLTKMAANASIFKFDMSQTFSLVERAMKPDGAIQLASAFQRMGVAVGDLTDPFQLMYKSLNDPEGLQESLSQMTKKFTFFDEKTKTFKISPEGILQMKELADQTSISYQSLSKSALAAANVDKALSQIKPGIKFESEDDKRMIANIARMGEGGEYEITLPNQDKATKISELTQEQIKTLLEEQRKTPKTIEETALAQLNLEEKANADINAIRKTIEGYVGSQRPSTELMTQADRLLSGVGKEIKDMFPKTSETRDDAQKLVMEYKTELSKLFSGEKLSTQEMTQLQTKLASLSEKIVTMGGDKVEKAFNNIGGLVKETVDNYKQNVKSAYTGRSVPGVKQAIQNINTKVDMGGTVTFKIDAPTNVNTRDLENYINSSEFKRKFYEVLLGMDANQRANFKRSLGF